MSKVRHGTDKGLTALAFNQMEQRCLEKSMQTLNLEQGYQLKLLNLDHRVLKVNYKHLKEKVARIRSHLSAEQINDLKQMEAEGKLKSGSSFNLNSALKIAAASKRLKLNGHKHERRRPKTAQPRMPSDLTEASLTLSRPTTGSDSHVRRSTKRSNSVVGAFIDAPTETNIRRVGSTSNLSTIRPVSASVVAARPPATEDTPPSTNIKRPATCVGSGRKRSTHAAPRHNSMAQMSSRSQYSSHSMTGKGTSGLMEAKDRRWSFMTDDSIDSNLGDNLYEERRRDLLSTEILKSKMLEKRKEAFIKGVNDYMKENPPDEFLFDPSEIIEIFQEENAADRLDGVIPRLRSRRSQRLGAWNNMSADEREEQYSVLWKDLNKCRYIRAPDSKLDFSGVVTLARDQLRMLNSLGSNKGESFLSSVQV